jgi:hypothetical protein
VGRVGCGGRRAKEGAERRSKRVMGKAEREYRAARKRGIELLNDNYELPLIYCETLRTSSHPAMTHGDKRTCNTGGAGRG